MRTWFFDTWTALLISVAIFATLPALSDTKLNHRSHQSEYSGNTFDVYENQALRIQQEIKHMKLLNPDIERLRPQQRTVMAVPFDSLDAGRNSLKIKSQKRMKKYGSSTDFEYGKCVAVQYVKLQENNEQKQSKRIIAINQGFFVF